MPRTAVTMAVYPSSSPDIVRFTVFCQARKYKGEVRAGGPPGAPILLRIYLPTPMKRGHRPRFLKGRMSRQFKIICYLYYYSYFSCVYCTFLLILQQLFPMMTINVVMMKKISL